MTRHSASNSPQSHPAPGGQKEEHHEEEPRAARHEAPAGVQPVEPEDPSMTGSGHSSQKDLLKQNVNNGQAQQHPESPAGQHATGSFTGKGKGSGK